MCEVQELFPKVRCQTRVWLSAGARQAIFDFMTVRGRNELELLQKLEHWARAGFRAYEGGEGFPIKHEWGQVFRVARRGSLFRIIGFYEDAAKSSFIVIDAFLKKKQNCPGPNATASTRLWKCEKRDCGERLATMAARIQDLHRLLESFKGTEESYGLDLRLDLSRIIVEQLKSNDWTQAELAERLEMKEAQVSRLVHGDANCTFATAGRILHALGVRATLSMSSPTLAERRRPTVAPTKRAGLR